MALCKWCQENSTGVMTGVREDYKSFEEYDDALEMSRICQHPGCSGGVFLRRGAIFCLSCSEAKNLCACCGEYLGKRLK